MVGCIDLAQCPPEKLLANKMLCFTAGTGTRKDDIGGVLMKTMMKAVAPTKRSRIRSFNSIAARCSIIGYDDSVL